MIHIPRGRSPLAAVLLLAVTMASPVAGQRPIPGLDAAGMDTTGRPGNDFYRFANGGWEQKTAIPPDRSSFGSFNIAAELANRQLTELVTGAAAAGARPGSETRLIGDFYTTWLDTVAIKARRTSPLEPLLARIAGIQDRTSLARFMGVQRYFPASAKAQAQKMVTDILRAFDKRIDALAWMAPQTKAQAKAKLKTIRVSVGYPDRWPSYDGLEVEAGDPYGNAERVEAYSYRQNIAKLHRPVDRDEWSMTPQTVNAVNMPAMNALNFPAAILQPPFFDPARTDAMNYAAIGAVIGHEISHSFDNLGAGFDAEGRLRNWWTPEDLAHFNASSEQLVKQYDAYRPLPDLAINGRLTLTENMADLAGITAAYDAWRASLRGRTAPVVGGLTGDQQFFLSFAQVWRSKSREPSLRQRLLTDGHSPGPRRALTVRNLDAWYDAFAVRPGDALYLPPAERVRIW